MRVGRRWLAPPERLTPAASSSLESAIGPGIWLLPATSPMRDRRNAPAGRAEKRHLAADSATLEDQCHPRKIFIGGLAHKTTTQHLREHFQRCGLVVDAVVLRWPDGRSRGFGYVTFADATAASVALRQAHQLGGRSVDVKRAVPGTNKLFVGGLPQNTTASELRERFEQFGVVSDAVVMIDPATSRSRGFGFICFLPGQEGAVAVQAALEQYEHHRIRGKWIEVKSAAPPHKLASSRDAAASSSAAASSPMDLGPAAAATTPVVAAMANSAESGTSDVDQAAVAAAKAPAPAPSSGGRPIASPQRRSSGRNVAALAAAGGGANAGGSTAAGAGGFASGSPSPMGTGRGASASASSGMCTPSTASAVGAAPAFAEQQRRAVDVPLGGEPRKVQLPDASGEPLGTDLGNSGGVPSYSHGWPPGMTPAPGSWSPATAAAAAAAFGPWAGLSGLDTTIGPLAQLAAMEGMQRLFAWQSLQSGAIAFDRGPTSSGSACGGARRDAPAHVAMAPAAPWQIPCPGVP